MKLTICEYNRCNISKKIYTKEELISLLKELGVNTRAAFRKYSELSDSVWEKHFGSWAEFVRAAGLQDNYYTSRFKSAISHHERPTEKLKSLQSQKETWGEKYLKPQTERFQTILSGSDLHDRLCDPFYRRLFVETARRVKPAKIVFAGDVFEMYEFSRYNKDPRSVDIVKSIKWVHALLDDLREASPDSEITMIEANHDLRLIKYIYESSENLVPVLAEIANIDFPQLVGIDKYEVNWVGKASVLHFNETDLKKEIKKNYYLAYDTVLFHHYPYAADWGFAGVNGHHHKHLVSQKFNAIKGPYEWHQLGGGHVRQASYCEGEVWTNGFILCHVDTHKKYTQFEYIDCTGDMCVIGGQWYTRSPDEIVKLQG